MRFASAVDSLTKENQFLRSTVKFLIFAILGLSLAVLFLHDKNPILVQKSSRGFEIVHATPLARTVQDIEVALKLMLKARFDSDAINAEVFLSKRQMELKAAEQREMKSRSISQSIVFRKADITKDEVLVEFDRVFAVGEVRSAMKTIVKVVFEETEPTELNPYGLKLALVSPIERKEGK